MVNFEKQGKTSIKNTGQVFITGHYLNALYHLNYLKGSPSEIELDRDKAKDRRDLTNFIRIYFQFAYYLGVSPFRFQTRESNEDGDKSRFSIHTWGPQTFLCAILYALCLLRVMTEARLSTPDRLDNYAQNPAQYFILIMNVFNFGYKMVFMKRVWRNKGQFLIVLNFIDREVTLPAGNAKLLRKPSVITIILSCYTAMALISLIAGKYFLSGIFEWTPGWWYRRLVASTRYMFFYGRKVASNEAPEVADITVVDQCLLFVNIVGLISRYLFGFYTDLCILATVMTLWSAAYSFANSFPHLNDVDSEDHPLLRVTSVKPRGNGGVDSPWPQIYQSFKSIRLLSYLLNNALGSIVCWFLGEAIMAYSVHLDAVLIARDIYKRLNLIFFYVCTFGILFVAADICNKMEAVKTWLTDDENRKNVPVDQIDIILHEMLAKDVGIRGSNIFTLTYSIAATFVGTIVTYFIICVQQNTYL